MYYVNHTIPKDSNLAKETAQKPKNRFPNSYEIH